MQRLKNMKGLRTSRNIRTFRSCQCSTGESLAHVDRARILREEDRLVVRRDRDLWLEDEWNRHFEDAAGPLRSLPPSARARRR